MDLIDGAVPAEQLESCVKELRRRPSHPGLLIRSLCMGEALRAAQAAYILGIPEGDLRQVLEGGAGISPELALRLEAAGWSTADLWMDLQARYDLAAARRRAAAA